MRLNYFFLLLFVFIYFPKNQAQEIIINDQGQKIIQFPDGSWRFYDENNPKDVELSLSKGLSIRDQIQNEADYQLYLELDRKSEFNQNWLNEVKMQIKEFEDELYAAKLPNSTYTKEEITELTNDIKDLKETEKEISLNLLYFDKEMKKLLAQHKSAPKNNKNKPTDITTQDRQPNVTIVPDNSNQPLEIQYKSYDEQKDVYLTPLPTPCIISYEGKDEFTGKKRIDTQRDLFFSYTSDELKTYYKGDHDFVICYAQFSKLDATYYLTLYVEISSKEAQKSFGMIEKGSSMTLRMIDNKLIKLINSKNSNGVVDNFQGKTTYTAQYIVNDAAIKALKETPLDKVRLVWSTGFEDYYVYNVDFLMKQAACISEKK